MANAAKYCYACGGDGYLMEPYPGRDNTECPYCNGTGKGSAPMPRIKTKQGDKRATQNQMDADSRPDDQE